jgi:hypothetical protein
MPVMSPSALDTERISPTSMPPLDLRASRSALSLADMASYLPVALSKASCCDLSKRSMVRGSTSSTPPNSSMYMLL